MEFSSTNRYDKDELEFIKRDTNQLLLKYPNNEDLKIIYKWANESKREKKLINSC